MKYVSKDNTNPTASPNSGFWVKDDTVYDVTFSSHVAYVIQRPALFNLTGQMIVDVYKKHGEVVGSESKARDELVRLAASSGWIRIRRYTDPRDYFSIQTDDTNKRRRDIFAFLIWAIEQNIMMPDSEARILGYDNPGDCREYKWADGGVRLFLSEKTDRR